MTPMPPVYLQTHFGAPIGSDLLEAVRQRGVVGCRLDLQYVTDPAVAQAMLEEVAAAGLQALAIVNDGDQVRMLHAAGALASRPVLELRNEPDLATNERLTPSAYSALIPDFDTALQTCDLTGYVGAISNLSTTALAWLRLCQPAIAMSSDRVGVSVHRYPHGNAFERWDVPHPGFADRVAEVAALERILAGRRWCVSETGYHLGPRVTKTFFGLRRTVSAWSEAQQYEQTRAELGFWGTVNRPPDFVVVYQIGSPPPESLDKNVFGWRRYDGTWRPVADLLG